MTRQSSKSSTRTIRRKASQARFFDDEAARLITHIEPLESDPNMRRVRVDGKAIMTLRACDVESLQLRPKMEWNDEIARRAETAQARLKCHALAMKLLGTREYARAELIGRLVKRGHGASIAQDVAADLVQSGWVNDARRADAIARAVTRNAPASSRLLIDRMADYGIVGEVARATALAYAGASEIEAASSLARKKMPPNKSKSRATVTKRIAGMLARRGFDEDIIAQALERIGLSDEDHA